MSANVFVSSATRLSANEANATYRPSVLIDDFWLSWLPCAPALLTLIRSFPRSSGRG
jgi:hypothetical protein